jgi:hypothetical protein
VRIHHLYLSSNHMAEEKAVSHGIVVAHRRDSDFYRRRYFTLRPLADGKEEAKKIPDADLLQEKGTYILTEV